MTARVEPASLLVPPDRQPDLHEVDAVVDEEVLERHDLIEEPPDLGLARELHDPFDTGAVVPGSIEERDLAARRQLLHVALEVPLPDLGVVRCRERDVTGEPGFMCSRIRWIVPPFPAVSRPSNRSNTRCPVARTHDCIFTSSICSSSRSPSYARRLTRSGVGSKGSPHSSRSSERRKLV